MTNTQTPTVELDLTNMELDELDYFAETLNVELEDYVSRIIPGTLQVEGVPFRKFLRTLAVIARSREEVGTTEERFALAEAKAGRFGMHDAMAMFGVDLSGIDDEDATPGRADPLAPAEGNDSASAPTSSDSSE